MAEETTRFPNSTVVICVDEIFDFNMVSRMYHCYTDQPIRLDNQLTMLQEMENLFNRLGYPQASTKDRKMITRKRESCKAEKPETAEKDLKMVTNEESIRKNTGERASFVVKVLHRQNATWQGSILWTEKGVTQQFRSALELIKLMDEALNETGNANTERKGTSYEKD